MKGIVLGLWDGISGPFVLIWDLIKLIGGLFQFFWRTVQTMARPETYRRILQGLQNAWQTIQTKIVPAIQELLSGRTNPLKIIGFIRGIIDKIVQTAKDLGAKAAEAFLGFLNLPDGQLGESLGQFVGNILFEVILTILTSGGYAAKPIIQRLSARLTSAVLKVREFVVDIVIYFPKLVKAIESIDEFASSNRAMRTIINAVKALLGGILDFIKASYGLAGAEERAGSKAESALAKGEKVAGEIRSSTKVVDALTGEAHEIKILADGRIFRCSDKCTLIFDSIRERTILVRKGLDPASKFEGQVSALESRAQGIAQKSKNIATLSEAERAAAEASLAEEATSIEKEMAALQRQVAGEEKVRWVDESTKMGQEAEEYQSWAEGARSNLATKKSQAPMLRYKDASGATKGVRFDGLEGDVLIDRKLSVTTYPKAQNQALRQSKALDQNGLFGRWEVPNEAEAKRALKLFQKLGITNIDVKVVRQ